ncbi:MAG: prephenate/arogenate dehydrogenase family protein, partial [Novosphingobium sp.]
MSEAPFRQVTIVGLGLLGGSIGHAVQAYLPGTIVVGWDADAGVRAQAAALGLAHRIAESAEA